MAAVKPYLLPRPKPLIPPFPIDQEERDPRKRALEENKEQRRSDLEERRHYRELRAGDVAHARGASPGFVYFIDDGRGAIKIGWAKDPSVRLAQLQTGSPVRLRLLGIVPGVKSLERDVHRRFGGLRLHGEWFKQSPSLLEFIERERV